MATGLLNDIKKCVTFIFVEKENGEWLPNGTGFLVGVKVDEKPDRYAVYLVTAKHVLSDTDGNLLPEIAVRLNRLDGESELIKISFKSLKIYLHSDPNVDIAVFDFLPDQKIFDIRYIADDLISDETIIKSHEIAEGDEVFFSGLFTSYIGQKRNQPIIRFGKVSLMSDEKIEWMENDKPAKNLDLYLMECQSFGGNSGSPVFFQIPQNRKLKKLPQIKSTLFLAGIMKGTFLNMNQLQVINTTNVPFSMENVGIAAVVPAYKLKEILFSQDAVEIRKTKLKPI